MHVVATAGHVDHGKSTLVRALTGMEPDRWAEEQRRGLTIDLGFAWTTLASGKQVAFVDVPGHERFISNTLAGVGPVPAVVLVVAADEGWMPQTDEHVRAAVALGARHMLLVVTKSDLDDPQPVRDDAMQRLHALGLNDVTAVHLSARTGDGLDDMRAALRHFVAGLPSPDPDAGVRLWIDRAFTVSGAGTVVTGTLQDGRIRVGETLLLQPAGRPVTVRGLQSLGRTLGDVTGPARVAVNLRGVDRDDVARGMSLVTSGAWTVTDVVDVVAETRLDDAATHAVVHVGTAAVSARVRQLGPHAARVRLTTQLPLHIGDRLLVRDPVARAVVGVDVADLAPAALRRRGDAAAVAARLQVAGDADAFVAARGVCRAADVVAAGFCDRPRLARRRGEWLVSDAAWAQVRARVDSLAQADLGPLSAGLTVADLARSAAAPVDVVAAAVADLSDVELVAGRIRPRTRPQISIPGLDKLLARLQDEPFAAPDAEELADLGLGREELAHATRSSLLLRLTEGVYVAADAAERAVAVLATLDAPFTVSEARQALATSRRVVVPLLEHLDAARRTRRLDDGRRMLVRPPA